MKLKKFEDTGLIDHPLVRRAFEYSLTDAKTVRADIAAVYTQLVKESFNEELDALGIAFMGNDENDDADPDSVDQDQGEFLFYKDAMIEDLEKRLDMAPVVAAERYATGFIVQRVHPALIAQEKSEHPVPELIAALLLTNRVRSHQDFMQVAAEFGPDVSDIVARLDHIAAYSDEHTPARHEKLLKEATPDEKRAYMAQIFSELAEIEYEFRKQAAGGLSPACAKDICEDTRILWGNDRTLEKHLVDRFNQVARVTGAPTRMNIGPRTELYLSENGKVEPAANPVRNRRPPDAPGAAA